MNKTNEFLATFFKDHTVYAEVAVNGFMLVQQINGATKKPVYCIYTMESFRNYKDYQKSKLF